jgi:hypothetical protein
MRKEVLRTYDAAGRVIAYCHEHPDPNPVTGAAVATLETLTGRMGDLLSQYQSGVTGADMSVQGKARIRSAVRDDLVGLQRFADIAAQRQPEIAPVFKLPHEHLNQKSFLATSRSILGLVAEHRDLLLTYGMPEGLPERIRQGLDQYESVEVKKAVSTQSHVGASAEIDKVRHEMLLVLRHLDALQRVRFADNAEMLAAWRSARDPHGPVPVPAATRKQKQAGSGPAA